MKKVGILLITLGILVSLLAVPTTASDNEPCEFANCACRFFLDDDGSRTILLETCKACAQAPNPYICTACGSWAGGLAAGCWSFTASNDNYYQGMINYCSAPRVAINLGLVALDLIPAGEATSEVMELLEFAVGELSGDILTQLKNTYANEQIDCSNVVETLPPREYIDIKAGAFSDDGSTGTSMEPLKPTSMDEIRIGATIYNRGKLKDAVPFSVRIAIRNTATNQLVAQKSVSVDKVLQPISTADPEHDSALVGASFPAIPNGNYKAEVFVDYQDTNDEYDSNYHTSYEANNIRYREFTVSEFTAPDLIVEEVVPENINPLQASHAKINVKIKNIGHDDVSKYAASPGDDVAYVRCSIGDNSFSFVSFDALAPGQTMDHVCEIPGSASIGQNKIKVKTGMLGLGDEEETMDNNEKEIDIVISPKIPLAPVLHTAPTFTHDSATITWEPITDTHVKKIHIYHKEGQGTPADLFGTITDMTQNTYTLAGLTHDQLHKIMIKAENDYNPPQTSDSNIVSGTTTPVIDISITAPTENAQVTGHVPITLAINDPNNKVASIKFRRTGHTMIGEDNIGSDGWGMTWDSSSVALGEQTIVAEAQSLTGNVLGSAMVKVEINNNPSPTITIPMIGPEAQTGTITLTANTNYLQYTDAFDKVAFYANPIGAPEQEFLIGEDLKSTRSEDSYNYFAHPWTVQWDTTTASDGIYTITAAAMNGADIVVSTTSTVEINNVAELTITLTEPTQATPASGLTTFKATTANIPAGSDADCVDFRYWNQLSEDHANHQDISLGLDEVKDDDEWQVSYDVSSICHRCSGSFYAKLLDCHMFREFATTNKMAVYQIDNGGETNNIVFTNPTTGSTVHGNVPMTVNVIESINPVTAVSYELCSHSDPSFGPYDNGCMPLFQSATQTGTLWTADWDSAQQYQNYPPTYPDNDYEIKATISMSGPPTQTIEVISGVFHLNNANPPPPPPPPPDPNAGTPDFMVLPGLTTEGTMKPGETVRLFAKVKNIGTAAARPVYRVCMKDPGMAYPKTMYGGQARMSSIAPGETKFLGRDWTVGDYGEYVWRVAIDTDKPSCSNYNQNGAVENSYPGDNLVAESNENNNIEDFQVYVKKRTGKKPWGGVGTKEDVMGKGDKKLTDMMTDVPMQVGDARPMGGPAGQAGVQPTEQQKEQKLAKPIKPKEKQKKNKKPIAEFRSKSLKGVFGLDASKSYDPDGHIVAYVWNMGGIRGREDVIKKEKGPLLKLTSMPGSHFEVTLVVVDDKGMQSDPVSKRVSAGGESNIRERKQRTLSQPKETKEPQPQEQPSEPKPTEPTKELTEEQQKELASKLVSTKLIAGKQLMPISGRMVASTNAEHTKLNVKKVFSSLKRAFFSKRK